MQLDAEGIIVGTPVVTPQGFQCIEKLNVGDVVTCYNFRTSRNTQQKITHITHRTSDHLIQLTINGDMFLVDVHQRVYLPIEQRWCQAKNLTPGDRVLASVDNVVCHFILDDVQAVDGSCEVYELTIPIYHNFCISEYGIITHNFFAFAPVASYVTSSMATSAATFATAVLGKEDSPLKVVLSAKPMARRASLQATAAVIGAAAAGDGTTHHNGRAAEQKHETPDYSPRNGSKIMCRDNNTYAYGAYNAIYLNDKAYTYQEKLGMSSISEIEHLNLGPDKPGPACPRTNPIRKVTYYDAAGKLLTGKELAMVKKQDIARRRAAGTMPLLPPVPAQKSQVTPNTCPTPIDAKKPKETVCGTAQQMPPLTSTCPSATDTKEPAPACGLQDIKIPVPPKQSCSSTMEEEKAKASPCNASQTLKIELPKNVENSGALSIAPKDNAGLSKPNALVNELKNSLECPTEKHLQLRDNAGSATAQSNLAIRFDEAKTAAAPSSQESEKREKFKKNNPNGRYEDAGYHKSYQSGQKSPDH
jgi:hypothetical protein